MSGLRHRCDYCGKDCGQKYRLDDHVKAKHQDELYYCQVDGCFRTFVSRGGLNEHVKQKHGTGPKLSCRGCGKLFFTQQKLSRHLQGKRAAECARAARSSDRTPTSSESASGTSSDTLPSAQTDGCPTDARQESSAEAKADVANLEAAFKALNVWNETAQDLNERPRAIIQELVLRLRDVHLYTNDGLTSYSTRGEALLNWPRIAYNLSLDGLAILARLFKTPSLRGAQSSDLLGFIHGKMMEATRHLLLEKKLRMVAPMCLINTVIASHLGLRSTYTHFIRGFVESLDHIEFDWQPLGLTTDDLGIFDGNLWNICLFIINLSWSNASPGSCRGPHCHLDVLCAAHAFHFLMRNTRLELENRPQEIDARLYGQYYSGHLRAFEGYLFAIGLDEAAKLGSNACSSCGQAMRRRCVIAWDILESSEEPMLPWRSAQINCEAIPEGHIVQSSLRCLFENADDDNGMTLELVKSFTRRGMRLNAFMTGSLEAPYLVSDGSDCTYPLVIHFCVLSLDAITIMFSQMKTAPPAWAAKSLLRMLFDKLLGLTTNPTVRKQPRLFKLLVWTEMALMAFGGFDGRAWESATTFAQDSDCSMAAFLTQRDYDDFLLPFPVMVRFATEMCSKVSQESENLPNDQPAKLIPYLLVLRELLVIQLEQGADHLSEHQKVLYVGFLQVSKDFVLRVD